MKRQWRLVLIATYPCNHIRYFVLLQQNEYDQTMKLLRAVSVTVGQGFACARGRGRRSEFLQHFVTQVHQLQLKYMGAIHPDLLV